jgi:hypothetical protein
MQTQTQISKAQQTTADDIICFCTSSCASIGTFVLATHYIFVVLLVYLAAFADSLSSAVDVEREPLVRSSRPAFPAAARQHRHLQHTPAYFSLREQQQQQPGNIATYNIR